MEYIIFDLEATCWGKKNREMKEIIEIGAVKLNGNLEVLDIFSQFVKPTINSTLSTFCKSLTGIIQKDVDDAPIFDKAIRNFEEWIFSSDREIKLISWGYYDKKQTLIESGVKGYSGKIIELLEKNHISLKHEFAKMRKERTCGMKQALSKLKIPLKGSHHRGIDDANNITQIFIAVFPKLKAKGVL